MPLMVKCRNCGNVIMDIRDVDSFSNFDLFSLEGKKCNVCGHEFHVNKVEYKIIPFRPSDNDEQKQEKRKTKKHSYIYIYTKLIELKTKKHPLYCKKCSKKFKVGDTVVVLRKGRYASRLHLDCYKKTCSLKIFVSPFRFASPKK